LTNTDEQTAHIEYK